MPAQEIIPADIASETTQESSFEILNAIRMGIELLATQSSRFMPDTSARNRVNVETGTLATVTSVTAVANQTNIGGIAANPQIPSLMMLTADNLRRNITVS